jgi:hypothetical protein
MKARQQKKTLRALEYDMKSGEKQVKHLTKEIRVLTEKKESKLNEKRKKK